MKQVPHSGLHSISSRQFRVEIFDTRILDRIDFQIEKMSSPFVFYDHESGIKIDFTHFSTVSSFDDVVPTYITEIREIFKTLKRIEKGDIVNHTEKRAVDHYNLRMSESPVVGKSLAETLKQWEDVKKLCDSIRAGELKPACGEKYSDIIFNGIGGSYLGPLMLIISAYTDQFCSVCEPKLHFISNSDPESFSKILGRVNLPTSIMVTISKSGSTAETRGNMEAFNAILEKNSLPKGEHNIAITTKLSMLDKYAAEHKFIGVFNMHNETGGRTSVGSPVGMVPCAFAGLDFSAFVKGQSHMDSLTRREDALSNPALLMAVAIHHSTITVGHKNMIVLAYCDALREFAHYLQQLWMESLGKKHDTAGRVHPEGQSVFGGVGTSEQHAFMQQVQQGIHDCFIQLISFRRRETDFPITSSGSMGRQLLSFVKGTEDALVKNKVPFFDISLLSPSLFSIGMLVALQERVVSFLAVMKRLNAYDQPGVQDGKLSAKAMDKLSLETEAAMAEGKVSFEKKSAEEVAVILKFDEVNLFFLEAILMDMCENIKLEGSYGKLKGAEMKFEFIDGQFFFTMSW
ncbi:glucose-6-phosphate isomerase, putative [Aduncisulcus paluster]|uniref:Glucose-6-phosphate isomerase n=1 Tax=Aduncisulcus paluster TaxID=2918883 RepID=A0ABQ5K902_9EUKA|nr:glucose-6-phosphate isomerase, putative [Aduncisulcus paluster]